MPLLSSAGQQWAGLDGATIHWGSQCQPSNRGLCLSPSLMAEVACCGWSALAWVRCSRSAPPPRRSPAIQPRFRLARPNGSAQVKRSRSARIAQRWSSCRPGASQWAPGPRKRWPSNANARVRIAEPFAVGRFAVTRGEFAAFIAATDHKIRASAIASRAHDGSARRAQTGARRVSHRTTATPLHA